jgi:hypothetical protein
MTSMTLPKTGAQSSKAGLLRLDTRGRARTGRERREALLAQFDRSGLSGARFARMAGIKYQTFAGWLHQRRARAADAKRPGSVTWVEAAVPPEPMVKPLRVQLPGGAWMEPASPAQWRDAALLLKELAKAGGAPC